MTKDEILNFANNLKNNDSYTWLQKRIIDCIFYGGIQWTAYLVDNCDDGMSPGFVSKEVVEQLKRDGFNVNEINDIITITW